MAAEPLSPSNNYRLEAKLTQRNTQTTRPEPATGLATVQGWIAATRTGAALHGSLQVAMPEATGALGTYVGILGGDVIEARFDDATLVHGAFYYAIVARGDTVEVWDRVQALDSRRAG
jgi:hypothetical protein